MYVVHVMYVIYVVHAMYVVYVTYVMYAMDVVYVMYVLYVLYLMSVMCVMYVMYAMSVMYVMCVMYVMYVCIYIYARAKMQSCIHPCIHVFDAICTKQIPCAFREIFAALESCTLLAFLTLGSLGEGKSSPQSMWPQLLNPQASVGA